MYMIIYTHVRVSVIVRVFIVAFYYFFVTASFLALAENRPAGLKFECNQIMVHGSRESMCLVVVSSFKSSLYVGQTSALCVFTSSNI